jgi:DNA-directed RNA polymerase subunit RPC12/RpoP
MEVPNLEMTEYVCRKCGTEHESEIEVIQCGCGYD